MSESTPIDLGEHFSQFIEAQVTSGRCGSASDVVQAGLRLLEEQEGKRAQLSQALLEGEQSGIAEGFDFDKYIEKRFGSEAADEEPVDARSS